MARELSKLMISKLNDFKKSFQDKGADYELIDSIIASRKIIGRTSEYVLYEAMMIDCLDYLGHKYLMKDDYMSNLGIFRWCQVNLEFTQYVRYKERVYFQNDEDMLHAALCFSEYVVA
jgi:hypothetical protein